MGTLYLQDRVLSVKKLPKRPPRKFGKFRKSSRQVVLRFMAKSVSVFSHGGDRGSKPLGTAKDYKRLTCPPKTDPGSELV